MLVYANKFIQNWMCLFSKIYFLNRGVASKKSLHLFTTMSFILEKELTELLLLFEFEATQFKFIWMFCEIRYGFSTKLNQKPILFGKFDQFILLFICYKIRTYKTSSEI